MYIHKHILVGGSVNHNWNKKNKEELTAHENIVIHYSAGASAISTVNYLNSPQTPVSAHLVIARDGTIYQMVDFNTLAWHAGNSEYKGKKNLNTCSVGIELENVGLLKKRDNQYYTWFGKIIPENQVIKLQHPQTGFDAWWQTYTTPQLNALREVCLLLLQTYRFNRIVGHSEISLSGKIDPGPAFPLDEFKKLIYH